MTRFSHHRIRQLAVLGCVVLATLALGVTPALGQTATASPSTGIRDVTYAGDGSVDVSDAGLVLWRSEPHQFAVTVSTPSEVDAEVCLVVNATGRELECEQATVPEDSTESITVSVDEWPTDVTGATTLDVVLETADSSDPVDRRSLAVTVLEKDGDPDGDNLTNRREVSLGTDPRSSDTDGDGISDGSEATTYESSPLFADSDNDGLSDGVEIKTTLTNPTKADTDGDGLLDSRERKLGTSPFSPDTDGDSITDAVEVNTYGTNATMADTDADGLDDGMELNVHRTNPKERDTDGDGLSDALEVITYETAPGDPDTDDDGLLDGAEVMNYRTQPTTADTDGDGLDDGAEVYTYETNPLNADTDGDGLSDGSEVNDYETNPLAVDTDGDGTNDRAEVQTESDPASPPRGPELIAGSVVLALTAAAAGFYWANGRVPGQHAVASVGNSARAAGRALVSRGEGRESETEPSRDAAPVRATNGHDAAEDVPVELLSNERRVLRLLDERDGQIRQSGIVEETGWSKAKVSRVLSKMEGEGDVAKFDVGRENIVTRPEDVPPGAKPPFES